MLNSKTPSKIRQSTMVMGKRKRDWIDSAQATRILASLLAIFYCCDRAAASAVAPTKRKILVKQQRLVSSNAPLTVPENETTFPHWLFGRERICTSFGGNNYPVSKKLAPSARTTRYQTLALAGLAMRKPAKRVLLTGLAAFYVTRKLQSFRKSEPIRRSIFFWRHAGPIVVRCIMLGNNVAKTKSSHVGLLVKSNHVPIHVLYF